MILNHLNYGGYVHFFVGEKKFVEDYKSTEFKDTCPTTNTSVKMFLFILKDEFPLFVRKYVWLSSSSDFNY